ncbi:LTA synthase family protein [Clostridium cylindrosporum]|nr:LTA synthase family protein [Clostridium cylindrosporum]
MFRLLDVIFFIDLFLIGIFLTRIKKRYDLFRRDISSFMILFLVPTIYLTYAHIKIDKLNKGFYNQTIFINSWAQNQTMSNLTPIGYHLFDIYNYLKDSKPYNITSSEKLKIETFFENKAELLPKNNFNAMFKGKNLIILQVESLENFVIGKSNNGQEITPNINKLLKNSIYFDNFLEQTHEGTTSDAEFMANTSIFPVRRGSTFFRFPSNKYYASLPNLMEKSGYSSIATHPDRGSYWNWLPSLSSIGFEKCVDSTSLNIDETIGLGLSDRSFLNQLANILEKQPKPFYSFSITLSSHTPYKLPKEHVNLDVSKDIKGQIIGSYFESVNYTDSAIGEFVNLLDKKGILNNSVVVIYGDHEGPHKYFKDEIKNSSYEPWMKDNYSKVPFIIYSKDISSPKVISTYGGQIDILPTISYLMGIPEKNYTYTSVGRNLLNTKLNYTYLSNGELKYNNLPTNKISLLNKSVEYSDIIIRSNYFRKE